MKGFDLILGAIVGSVAVLAEPSYQSPPGMPVQYSYKGFSFSPGRSCDTNWIDASFCEATSPKSWSMDEFKSMQSFLDPLFEGRLSAFLKKIQDKGFVEIHRYAHGFRTLPDAKFARDEHSAWVWGFDRSINVSDFAFLSNVPLDPLGHFDLHHQSMLHEMAHAFAFNEAELMKEFQTLLGWSEDGRGNYVLTNVDMQSVARTVGEMRSLIIQGKFAEGMQLNREFGIQHGFPTAYAMVNPNECFAELMSHIYYDPSVSKYLRPEIIDWFNKNVLK